MSVHKIIRSHVIPALKTLPDEHVDMLMTSVPYWGLRDYGADTATIWGGDKNCEHVFNIIQGKRTKDKTDEDNIGIVEADAGRFPLPSKLCSKCGAWYGQLGLEPTPELYIEHLRMVFVEIKRVLKKTGTCWVNIGDSYNSNSGFNKAINGWPREGRKGGSADKNEYADLPAKCMCMIPERFLMMMVLDLGFILRNKNIWKKDNPMPSSVKDRFNNVWEPVYFFTKNNKPMYWYNDKTGLMVEKRPTSQIEGVDWDWKENEVSEEVESEEKYPFTQVPITVIKTVPKIVKKKVSHWHSADYWFDLDAVREPWTDKRPADIKRAEENHPGYPGKYGSGYNAEYRNKLPGQGIKGQPVGNPDSGKNPGDVFYNSKYTTEHGQPLQGFIREQSLVKERQQSRADAKILFPHDKKKQQEYINFIHDHAGHPLGANPGDFWAINTKPFPGAHFAVFPGKLCEKPILAGCPAEVCKHCGMARVRITNRTGEVNQQWGERKSKPWFDDKREMPQKVIKEGIYETIGWTDCICEDENKYEPGIIIDIFGGSGTVSIEAEKAGRDSIYIDIKRNYCEMALKRLRPLAEQTKLSGEQSKVIRIGF